MSHVSTYRPDFLGRRGYCRRRLAGGLYRRRIVGLEFVWFKPGRIEFEHRAWCRIRLAVHLSRIRRRARRAVDRADL
ncbi:hypothetical protein [Microbacterium sp.]|uniref:hypothetical protein n=1 Tax=Microbacterium sp. TaxID=51671 RepID=UPI002729E971|nr:hypothetical protein [Microbacterium sp.]